MASEVLTKALERLPELVPEGLPGRRYDVSVTFRVTERTGGGEKPFHETSVSYPEMGYGDVVLLEGFLIEMLANLASLGNAVWAAANGNPPR